MKHPINIIKRYKIQSYSKKVLDLESKKSFDFFWKEANTDKNSPGFGLIRDRAPGNHSVSSIASVGFGLTAIIIGAKRHWISHEQAYDRALGTISTLLNNAEQINGFFYHFLDMDTAKRTKNSEVSIIDTAIAISGAITAGEYFGNDVMKKAEDLYKRVNWQWYLNTGTNQFYMGYSPEKGFFGAWDSYAEQFMMYFLAAASPTYTVNSNVFYDFKRIVGSYGHYPPFIHTWTGSLFTYQYSYAWFDMRNKIDKNGVDWWENSIIATKTNRQFCIDYSKVYKTYGADSWGLTASDGPFGYSGGYGAMPSGYNNDQNSIDGTVPPAGAAGSIVFTPNESIQALINYYDNYKSLWGKYGFKDAFNLDCSPEWYDDDVIGIDKGITLLMIENYRTGFVWNIFMKNKYVQAGMKKVGLTDIASQVIDDFDGNSLATIWADGGNKVYEINKVNDLANTGISSLKVQYRKNGEKNAYFYTYIGKANIEHMDKFVFSAYGNVKLLICLRDNNGIKIDERFFDIRDKNKWTTHSFNISMLKDKLSDISKIEIIAAPGDGTASGVFYLDDIEFKETKPVAHAVLIDGEPIVGNILKGNYVYYNADGINEGKSNYKWLISDSLDGEFEPIQGANSITYKLRKEDAGKYIKFEVVPKTKISLNRLYTITGRPVQSAAIGEISEQQAVLAANN